MKKKDKVFVEDTIDKNNEIFLETSKRFKILTHYAMASTILWDNRNDIYAIWQKATELSKTVRELRSEKFVSMLSSKTKSIVNLLNYLAYVESIGVSLIDVSLMILIANGKEMHTRGPRITHVSKLRELQKLDLSYKIYFLKANGLDYFAGLVDRNLRNDIAHLKFEVNDEGVIKDSNGKIRKIDEIIVEFLAKVACIAIMFDDVKLTDWLMKPYKTER